MQHFNNMRFKGGIELASLRREFVAILFSLLLTWLSHTSMTRKNKIKAKEARCDVDSSSCVPFYLLELPDAQTFMLPLTELFDYGINALTGRKLCWTSLFHHIDWHHNESSYVFRRDACLYSFQGLRDMYETREDE